MSISLSVSLCVCNHFLSGAEFENHLEFFLNFCYNSGSEVVPFDILVFDREIFPSPDGSCSVVLSALGPSLIELVCDVFLHVLTRVFTDMSQSSENLWVSNVLFFKFKLHLSFWFPCHSRKYAHIYNDIILNRNHKTTMTYQNGPMLANIGLLQIQYCAQVWGSVDVKVLIHQR